MRRFIRPLRLTVATLALTIAVSPVYASTMSEVGTNTVTENVSAISEDTKDAFPSSKDEEGELKEDLSEGISKDTPKNEESKETESENTETEGEKEQAPSKAEDDIKETDTKKTEVEMKETETETETPDDTVKESQSAKENEKTDTVLSDEKTPNEAETTQVKNEVKEIEAVKIVLPKPVRDGYEFVEWNTRIDGEGESYQAGDEIEVTPMALYAIWREV